MQYIAIDNIEFPHYNQKTKTSPIYNFNIFVSKNKVYCEVLWSSSQTKFIGEKYRQTYSVYDNSSNSNVLIYDFYTYQDIKYQFAYYGIGGGYKLKIRKRHSLNIGARWLFSYSRKTIVTNHFTNDIPIVNKENLELASNVRAISSTSSNTNQNYGLIVSYSYILRKHLSLETGIDYFSFKFIGVNYVETGHNIGIFYNQANYLLRYSIQKHSSLNLFTGIKFYF